MTNKSAPDVRVPRAAVSAAFFCQGFAFASLITRIPAIQDTFELSDGALALLLAAIPIVAGVGSVTAGALAVRFHSAPVLRLGGVLVSLSLVAVGLATNADSLAGLVAVLIVVGFGLGSVDATMNMQGIGVQAAARRTMLASFHAWWSLATILGALAASVAAATPLSLLGFFAIIAACLIPVQLLASTRFLHTAESDEAAADPLADASVPWRPLLVFGAAVVGAFVIDSSVSNWSAVDLVSVLGATESVAALAYAAYAVAMLTGRTVTDRLTISRGPAFLVRAGAVTAALGLAGVALAPNEVVAILAFAVVGLGVSPILPLAFTAASHHDPKQTGVAVARVNVGNYIGFVLGAPLVGVIGEFSSLRVGFAVLVVVALAITFTAASFER